MTFLILALAYKANLPVVATSSVCANVKILWVYESRPHAHTAATCALQGPHKINGPSASLNNVHPADHGKLKMKMACSPSIMSRDSMFGNYIIYIVLLSIYCYIWWLVVLPRWDLVRDYLACPFALAFHKHCIAADAAVYYASR